jgi:hypothetical protein
VQASDWPSNRWNSAQSLLLSPSTAFVAGSAALKRKA